MHECIAGYGNTAFSMLGKHSVPELCTMYTDIPAFLKHSSHVIKSAKNEPSVQLLALIHEYHHVTTLIATTYLISII